MRRISKGIVTFAMASAALAAPALATATPAAAATQTGLVNVYVEDVLNHNQIAILQNVSVPVAAALCNINANVLSAQLANFQKGDCPAFTTSKQIAWVSQK